MLSLIRSKSVGASLGFAFAGAAFTLGNLLLARELPAPEFGQLALAIAVYNLFIWLAPLGTDQVLLRRSLDPGPRLLLRVLASCSVIAAIAVLATSAIYALPARLTLLLGAAVMGGGLAMAGGMGLRRHGWTTLPLAATNVASWSLLMTGMLGFVVALSSAIQPLIILAIAAAIAAVLTWGAFIRHGRLPGAEEDIVPRGEALSLMIAAAAGALLVQVERFVIPHVLDYESLAIFTVLASVAIFPFRLLRSGSSFALVPRLRAASESSARFTLLIAEGRALAVTLLFASVLVVALAPSVAAILTDGRYRLDRLMLLAACFNGIAKLLESLPQSAVVACGTTPEVRRLSWMSWLNIVACILGAWLGARWGLMGLIWGSAIGCVIGTVPSALLARKVVARGFVE
jgi:O-antigen/teichoic acid export membrane protein